MFQRNLWAASKPVDSHFWALFSDPHIAADRAQIGRGINMSDHLETVTREVTSLPRRPAALLVNGDCAFNSGEQADYATFSNLLQPLREAGVPLHLTVGNHDEREHFWNARSQKQNQHGVRSLTHSVALIKTCPRANWTFLIRSEKLPICTPGLLGTEQLKWLARSLDDNHRKPALVVVHHQLTISGDPKVASLQDERTTLLEIIRPRKQTKALRSLTRSHATPGASSAGRKRHSSGELTAVDLRHSPSNDGPAAGCAHLTANPTALRLELRCIDTNPQESRTESQTSSGAKDDGAFTAFLNEPSDRNPCALTSGFGLCGFTRHALSPQPPVAMAA